MLLDRGALELLELFAAGNTTPGAGSAAALMGATAASLAQTVARHTLKAARSGKRRETYAPFRERAEALLEQAGDLGERLRRAVDEDAAAFDRFWKERTEETQRRATEVPIEIAELCLAVARVGLELWEKGARSAQGEASAATLGALAGGETAAHVAHLNLKFAGPGDWTESRKTEVRDLRRHLRDFRELAKARIYDHE
ncbi:MAG TPA: cyclodeaminase/cyclohydrolase family protein [Thermoanaerobaculia bacterium]|nr:cyclodeaminase/cyclohydrolase family protein [Thermoanaerobaculia bacterium]